MHTIFQASIRVDGQRYDARQCTCPVVSLTETERPYLYRQMTLHNPTAQNTLPITEPYTLDAALPCTDTALLHTLRGDNCSAESFLPIDHALAVEEVYTMCPSGGRSSNTTAFPFFDLTLDGKPYLFAIGWSGQWQCVLHRQKDAVTITVGLARANFYMLPGETLRLPSVLVMEGMAGEDAPALRRRFRQLLATDFSPLPAGMSYLPISIQPFDRYFYGRKPEWPTEEGLLETLERTKECHYMDTFWFDAGWFPGSFPQGVGNYHFAEGFPRGLAPVAKAVHQSGMNFMVWFEPERVYSGTEVHREHPEFLLSWKPEDAQPCWWGDTNHHIFDLGNDAAWQWMKDTLVRFIRDNGIDIYRQDFNIDPFWYWCMHDQPGREGVTEMRHIDGLYRLWDALRAEFPYLMIDDCASGGRRIDLETMRRAVPMWRSDVTCHPITDTMHCDVWNQNETLALGEYLPYHACAAWEPRAFEIRAAATSGLACTFDILNPAFDTAAARVALCEIEHLTRYWKGDFYPLTTPTLAEDCFAAFQLALPDSGYAAVFRRVNCANDSFVLALHVIDPAAAYTVSVTDEAYQTTTAVVSGSVLIDGYTVTLPTPHSSAIIEYKKIQKEG